MAGWSVPYSLTHGGEVFSLLQSMPFSSPRKHAAWPMSREGGRLLDDMYARRNIKGVLCGLLGQEGFWFQREIRTVGDLRNLKVRTSRLGTRIFQKAGAKTILLPAAEIMPALDLGRISGAECGTSYMDLDIGLNEVVKYYYHPSWHQSVIALVAMFNRGKWNGISAGQRRLIETVCAENVRHALDQDEMLQRSALDKLRQKGVRLRKFPESVLNALRSGWEEVAAELSSTSPDFRRIYSSFRNFR